MPATRCSVCGKGPVFGHQISHAHNVSTRKQYPNIQQVRAVMGGQVKRIAVSGLNGFGKLPFMRFIAGGAPALGSLTPVRTLVPSWIG